MKMNCPIIVIGGSAGSLEVVLNLVASLRDPVNATLVIIMHRKSSVDSSLVFLLSERTEWPVREVEDKDQIRPRHIYLAPADYHLLFEKDLSFSLDYSEKVNYSRPSIDVSFESAAEAFGSQVTGILLSGANADGVHGLNRIKAAGGTTVVQNPSTAEVAYMPQEALDHAIIDHIIDGNGIGQFIDSLGRIQK